MNILTPYILCIKVLLIGAAGVLASSLSWSLEVTSGPMLTMDPNGSTPLAGIVELETDVPARATLVIDNGADKWAVEFGELQTTHALPVLGLEPDNSYTVDVMLTDQALDNVLLTPSLQAVTAPLPIDFPVIEVLASNPALMEPGFTLMSKFTRGRGVEGTTYSIIVDDTGDVVWYSTYGGSVMLQKPNGELFYREDNSAIEADMLGNVVGETLLQDPGLGLHHELFPTAHGTFLSLTREVTSIDDFPTSEIDPNAPTQTTDVEDNPVVEFASDGTLLNTWPLLQILDPGRIGYDGLANGRSGGRDWAHANAVTHDPRDDSIIVSVRHQDAVIKFSRTTGQLIWILGNHANWGPEYQPFLLQPVGSPFQWQYHEHSPMITPAGTLLLFDNGNERASPFDGTEPVPDEQNFSRAVEFAIDEQEMEVRQVWEYGGQIPETLFTPTISDADAMPVTGNILIDFGNVSHTGGIPNSDIGRGLNSARIIEVDHSTPAEKVFDIAVYNPDPEARITIYRTERIPSLYPPGATLIPDSDSDGTLDNTDNCLAIYNEQQLDTDGDGHGNVCDADLNNDCITNFLDLNMLKDVFFTGDPDADLNGDGTVNFIDLSGFKLMFFTPPGPSAAGVCAN